MAAVFALLALDMAAIPTEREILLTQPDGYTFTAYLKGDEYGQKQKSPGTPESHCSKG